MVASILLDAVGGGLQLDDLTITATFIGSGQRAGASAARPCAATSPPTPRTNLNKPLIEDVRERP